SLMRRWDSAAIVAKTSELLPEPDTPVNTVSRRFGISTLTSLRLFSRAPWTRMRSCRSAGGVTSRGYATAGVPGARSGAGLEQVRAEVALAGVGQDHHDHLALELGSAGDLLRGVEGGTAGDAGEDALGAGEAAGGLGGAAGVHTDDLVVDLGVEHVGHE